MENNSLTSFYDNLKSNMNSDKGTPVAPMATTAGIPARTLAPAATPNDIINHKLMHHCNKLREDCRKHLLLDIYVKILPLDDDFKTGHMGMMKNDIDCMLANKGMNATQYLTSCSEATKAPLLEYLMRATDLIARQYLKEAEEEIKDAKENGVSNPEVKEPSIDDQEVQDQLVDLKKDSEYKTFVDELKAKTVNKIVNDVSALIDDKKDESDMTFDPVKKDEAPVAESTFMVGMDYLQKKMGSNINESVQDEMIGLAIRESALNIIDLVFNQRSGQFNEFASRIRWGKGVLINESCELFTEASKADKKKKDKSTTIIDIINSIPNLKKLDKATTETIEKAENKLGLKFADDYKLYLAEFGAISGEGIELTGIAKSKHTNVIEVTKCEWECNKDVPHTMYVIETADIDGIVMWQDEKGIVYQSRPYKKPVKIAESLQDYITKEHLTPRKNNSKSK